MATGFCVKCGAELLAGAVFCAGCGAAVVGSQPESVSPPTPQEPVSPPPAAEPASTPPRPPTTPRVATPALVTNNRLYAIIAAVVAVLLIGGVLVFTGGDKHLQGTAPGEVFLEPADYPGEAPFTASVDTNTAPAPAQIPTAPSATTSTAPSATPSATTAESPAAPEPVGMRSVQGPAPGLYGGTQDESACDAAKLIDFLLSNPNKAAAWASVQGITPNSIPAFVRSLTPVVLRADTRVTNHGYFNGVATPLQSVLQAGTAVLVDDLGQPRVKCNCGNPLSPPRPQQQGVRYTGDRWPTFRPNRVLVVVNTTRVRVTKFVLVNLVTPGYIERPAGAPAPGEPPADGEVLTDSLCDMFPEDCQPSNPDEPVLGTGDVQVTLRWNSTADLDLTVVDPNGERVYFDNPSSSSGGTLDVDSNGSCENLTSTPVENVFWPTGAALDGQYTVAVIYYGECPGGTGPQNFELTVLVNGVEVPMSLQLLVADGSAEATADLLVANGQPRMDLYQTITEKVLPDQVLEGGFVKGPPPTEPPPPAESPPTEEPPAGEQPAEPPMTLEEYCKDLFPEPPAWVIGPENMNYTLCMHDPTDPNQQAFDQPGLF